MEKRRLLVVGNQVPEDWEFRRGVEAETGKSWDIRIDVINRYDGLHKYTRYLTYIFSPLRLFFTRNRYEKMIYWEQFLGLMLVFFCRLFHVKTCPEITIMALIYKPKKGLVGKLFHWFVKRSVTSRYVKRIIVYSQSEVDYYSGLFGVPKEKFSFEPLGLADRKDLRAEEKKPEKYYLSAGRSNRDYDFLRQAWPRGGKKITVVCDVEKAEDGGGIHYEKSCHGDDYLRLLSGAYASVVPLQSEKISSGQLVFLQSFMFGVPVIATKNDTVPVYVDDGVTGFIIDKTPEALRTALEKLDDPETRQRMSSNARKAFEERYSLFEMGRRVGRAAME